MFRRNFDRFMALLIALWTGTIVWSSLVGIPLFFPFTLMDPENVPMHRVFAVRVSIFSTMLYFSLAHLFGRDRKYRPVHFLKIYLNILVITAFVIYVRFPKASEDLDAIISVIILALLVNIASRDFVRSYFTRR